MATAGHRPTPSALLRGAARLAGAAGLAVDAYVHADLADRYDAISATVSQGDLFRTEAGLAGLAALLILVWRHPIGDAFAWLVAAGGLAAIVLFRYVNVGAHGPLPDMYEPIWSSDKKTAAVAQVVTVVAATLLLTAGRRTWRTWRPRRPV
jgi:hypothetical protein